MAASDEFAARRCADVRALWQELEHRGPAPSFLARTPTPALSVARPHECWIFSVSPRGDVAVGFLTRGRLARSLQVVLVPEGSEPDALCAGLRRFAKAQRLSRVTIEGVGASRAPIPRLEQESGRRLQTTWSIDLAACDLDAALSKNHRRNVRKAVRSGVRCVETTDASAIRDHLRLCGASLSRRSSRGEAVESRADAALFRGYLRSHLATFFQARVAERVLSSDLVVRIGEAAWYTSGGSDPQGMNLGTSQFLMFELARHLQRAGCATLNLGFSEDPGLDRFKAGFGAQPVPVERVTCEWGSGWTRWRERAIAALVARLRRR
ncbi:MAG: GNAT family N-acetyltransferase [Deltaproteobacteria bacterium]|nr:MAG: GNAT family N-acetyltransferase [Deltaproteobacteria bacterium]